MEQENKNGIGKLSLCIVIVGATCFIGCDSKIPSDSYRITVNELVDSNTAIVKEYYIKLPSPNKTVYLSFTNRPSVGLLGPSEWSKSKTEFTVRIAGNLVVVEGQRKVKLMLKIISEGGGHTTSTGPHSFDLEQGQRIDDLLTLVEFIGPKPSFQKFDTPVTLGAILDHQIVLQINTGKRFSETPTSEEEQPATPFSMSLHAAAVEGNLQAIKQHIAAGTNLDEKWPSSPPYLAIASIFGHTEAVKALIEAGADVNCRDKDESTPLHYAAFLCRTDIVKLLLDNGADKDAEKDDGTTALGAVTAPFDDVKEIYDALGEMFGPQGLKLDYERIKATRSKIAEMLRQ